MSKKSFKPSAPKAPIAPAPVAKKELVVEAPVQVTEASVAEVAVPVVATPMEPVVAPIEPKVAPKAAKPVDVKLEKIKVLAEALEQFKITIYAPSALSECGKLVYDLADMARTASTEEQVRACYEAMKKRRNELNLLHNYLISASVPNPLARKIATIVSAFTVKMMSEEVKGGVRAANSINSGMITSELDGPVVSFILG